MIQSMIRAITARHHLTGMNLGEYRKMKIKGMDVQIFAFRAEGIGHVSAMQISGFLGLSKRDTLVINPDEVDLPMFCYERIYGVGSDTMSVELIDTLLQPKAFAPLECVRENVANLPDVDPCASWYDSLKLKQSISKKGRKADQPALDHAAMDYLTAYLDSVPVAYLCDPVGKLQKAYSYVEGMLEHGGAIVDPFMKTLGAEKTGHLFRNILFGTGRI